jgi:hypothetical protein
MSVGYSHESFLAEYRSAKVFTPGRGERQCLLKDFLLFSILSFYAGERRGHVRQAGNLPDRVVGGCRAY